MKTLKTVVITGGSAGIGAETAKLLVAQGFRVVLAARSEDKLGRLVELLGNDRACAVPTDVTRREQVQNLCEVTLRKFGSIDVWINNAGRGITHSVMELDDAMLDEMMTINVKSALYGMQAVVPQFMKQGRGHLINVSSFLGRVPAASFRSAYSAAKAALNSLTTNLRMDLSVEYPALKVSLVMPGMVNTEFAKNSLGGLPKVMPTHMVAQPAEEVAAQIVALIKNPVDELYTNQAAPELIRKFYKI